MLAAPIALLACGHDAAVEECIDDNPILTDADAVGDQVFALCEASDSEEPTDEPPTCDVSTIGGAERGCEEDGAPCDGTIAVSRAAAICIADERADISSLEGPYAELIYHSGYKRPVWSVLTVTNVYITGGRGGDVYMIDAANGGYLGKVDWNRRFR